MAKKEVFLQVAVPQEFKDELIKDANKKGLTLSAYVRLILIERNK